MDNERFGEPATNKKTPRKRPWWYMPWWPDPNDPVAQDKEIDMVANARGGGCAPVFFSVLAVASGIAFVAVFSTRGAPLLKGLDDDSPIMTGFLLGVFYLGFLLGMLLACITLVFKHLQRFKDTLRSLERRVAELARQTRPDGDDNAE